MLRAYTTLAVFSALVASASAYTLKFNNKCSSHIYPGVGAAPNGQPQATPKFGADLAPGATSDAVNVAEDALGVRAWGRADCTGSGASLKCSIGNCNGGLTCTDAGITANTIFAEFGPSNGNTRTAWDLSYAQSTRNMPISISASDGQSVKCTQSSCPPDQAFNDPNDFGATRNSAQKLTYTVTFCPDGGQPGKW